MAKTPTKAPPSSSYVALAIVPAGRKGLFSLLTINMVDDQVASIERSRPAGYHICVYESKHKAARVWAPASSVPSVGPLPNATKTDA